MVTKDSKAVLFDSDEAAHYRTNLSGWVSRHEAMLSSGAWYLRLCILGLSIAIKNRSNAQLRSLVSET